MEMTSTCPTAEVAAMMSKFIKEAGGNSTWDRLSEYLDETDNGRKCFVINRSFEASIEHVFEMWTDPELFSKWLPPIGCEMTFIQTELREGGTCFFRMSNGADFAFYGQLAYLEIKKPSRIVYVQRFCDEQQKIGCHPGLPVFPEALLITVIFTKESEKWTRVTVTSEPMGAATVEQVAAFINLRSSMTQGWSGSFDKLEQMIMPATP